MRNELGYHRHWPPTAVHLSVKTNLVFEVSRAMSRDLTGIYAKWYISNPSAKKQVCFVLG